jgi:hypothetical protein
MKGRMNIMIIVKTKLTQKKKRNIKTLKKRKITIIIINQANSQDQITTTRILVIREAIKEEDLIMDLRKGVAELYMEVEDTLGEPVIVGVIEEVITKKNMLAEEEELEEWMTSIMEVNNQDMVGEEEEDNLGIIMENLKNVQKKARNNKNGVQMIQVVSIIL